MGGGPGMVTDLSPDVVVLDVNMPAMSGLEVTMASRRGFSGQSAHSLNMTTQSTSCRRSGRRGRICAKDVSPAELRDAVIAVHEGRDHFTARVTQQLSVGLRREIEEEQLRARLSSLTQREREVLLLVAQGLTNREAGGKLEISPRTVETHRERVMDKLRIRTVAGLTRFVVEHSLDDT